MKSKHIVLLIFLCLYAELSAFQVPKRIMKKVQKEITKTFESDAFQLEEVLVSKQVNAKLGKKIETSSLFQIAENSVVIGYAYIAKAPSKTDEFDYLILLDATQIIKKTKILVYREDYGGEIGSRRWLKQFIGKSSNDNLKYRKDIIAISGATISALSMTQAVNQFLVDLKILQTNDIF